MMMLRSHWQMPSKTLFRSKDDLSKKITQIADDTKKLINDLNKQEEMIKNQEKYIHRNTCDSISKLIINEINIGG